LIKNFLTIFNSLKSSTYYEELMMIIRKILSHYSVTL